MKINDAIFGVFFLLLAAALFVGALSMPKIHGLAYGPSLYPMVISIAFVPLAIGLIVSGLSKWQSGPPIEISDWVRSPRQLIGFCAVIASVLFYILAAEYLGFWITSMLILTCLIGWLWRKIWASLGLAVVITAVLHVFFYTFLFVPLPWGVLKPISW